MSNERGAGADIIILGVGILAGAFMTFLFLKGKEHPQTSLAAQQPQILMIPSPMPQYAEYEHMSAELQRLDAELRRMRQENSELRAQLQIAAPQGPVMTVPAVKEKPPIRNENPRKDSPGKLQALQNEEVWELKKDKRGRLEGITVHRRVSPVG